MIKVKRLNVIKQIQERHLKYYEAQGYSLYSPHKKDTTKGSNKQKNTSKGLQQSPPKTNKKVKENSSKNKKTVKVFPKTEKKSSKSSKGKEGSK